VSRPVFPHSDARTAAEFLERGNFYWNAGMFFWRAASVLELMRRHQPKTTTLLAGLPGIQTKSFAKELAAVYPLCENISVDYAIIEKAHRVGALVVLDTFQSLGTVPVDVQALNADFACGGVLKWLCGGPGVAYLYVRPDLAAKLNPRFTGWSAHVNPFAFEIGATRYAEPPFRFMNGTPHIPALEAARPHEARRRARGWRLPRAARARRRCASGGSRCVA